jgi:micrococcal nuclease
MRNALLYAVACCFATHAFACGEGGEDEADAGLFFSRDATARADTGVAPSSGILVESVFDGDTMRVRAASTVRAPDGRPLADSNIRFLGIDAPEIAHPPQPADCWGPESAAAARTLLAGKFVELEYDTTHELRDTFDRILAYIRLPDGRVANEVLVQEGHARSFRAFQHKFTDRYNMLESQARSANLGLWTCPD